MVVVKRFLLGLLILIVINQIFTVPGIGNFELFNKHFSENKKIEFNSFTNYSPGEYLVLSNLLKLYPLNTKEYFFFDQNVWIVQKFTLIVFYFLTWASFLYLRKTQKKSNTSYLDVSIFYFGSISVILASISLAFFDIFAAPFLIFSVAFLIQNKFTRSILLYLLSALFNPSLIVLILIFLICLFRSKKNSLEKLLPFFLLSLTFLLITPLFIERIINSHNLYLFGFPWLIKSILTFIAGSKFIVDPFLITVLIISAISAIIIFRNLIIDIFFAKFLKKKLIRIFTYLIAGFLLFGLPIIFNNLAIENYLFIYSIFTLFISKQLIKNKIISSNILSNSLFCFYSVFVLFCPGISNGNVIWLTLFSLIIYILDSSSTNLYLLVVTNLFSFLNLYLFLGTAGNVPVNGTFFQTLRFLFAILFLYFISYFLKSNFTTSFNIQSRGKALIQKKFKYIVIILIVLLNLSLIPSDGTGDHVSWTQYAVAGVEYPNPFLAYAKVDNPYPPLSSVIISIFANLWRYVIGISSDYTIAIKLSVITFSLFTVVSYIKFSNLKNKNSKKDLIDKLIVVLTTFSLTIQTQGLADLNIYVLPSLFAAMFFLFKDRVVLAGVFMGLTLAIKWQPVILLPLFFLFLINSKNLKLSFLKLFKFILGMLIVPILSWGLVLREGEGYFATKRAFNFIIHGASMLSGQALNLNWIATYLLHYFQFSSYQGIETLNHLGGLNRQIGTALAPTILQGYFFIAVVLAILWRFIKSKRGIVEFLSGSVMIFFSHQMLNKSAYEKHIFYITVLMLFLYLFRPTEINRRLLILFDVMTVMNLALFYGLTGPKDFNRLFFGFDLTILFSLYYLIIYAWIAYQYFKSKGVILKYSR